MRFKQKVLKKREIKRNEKANKDEILKQIRDEIKSIERGKGKTLRVVKKR
jgi:hypothetical protein